MAVLGYLPKLKRGLGPAFDAQKKSPLSLFFNIC